MTDTELDDIDKGAWDALKEAATDRAAALRYLTLCTVDAAQSPQARTVVLRNAAPELRQIEIHTDVRSAKWQDLSRHNKAQILGLDAGAGLQLRLSGSVSLFDASSRRSRHIWDTLPSWTRNTYAGGSPGALIADSHSRASPEEPDTGRLNFGVLVFQAEALDWVRLQRGANQRARICYDDLGACLEATWVFP